MSTESLKTELDECRKELKFIKKRLAALPVKEDTERTKLAQLQKDVYQADKDYDEIRAMNLTGDATDQAVSTAKARHAELVELLSDVTGNISYIASVRAGLNGQFGDLRDRINVARAELCNADLHAAKAAMAKTKVSEKLLVAFSIWVSATPHRLYGNTPPWNVFLIETFPEPNGSEVVGAIEKFKADTDYMKD
jgi:predicted  nucleic acid-binding Zn-ribbon protein